MRDEDYLITVYRLQESLLQRTYPMRMKMKLRIFDEKHQAIPGHQVCDHGKQLVNASAYLLNV